MRRRAVTRRESSLGSRFSRQALACSRSGAGGSWRQFQIWYRCVPERKAAVESNSKNVTFADIATEFSQTFGYIRQDIAAIRNANLGLNYTMVLLICCACEMLAWHKDLDDDQVFTSLLPDGRNP
jgi:hypothetical protein